MRLLGRFRSEEIINEREVRGEVVWGEVR